MNNHTDIQFRRITLDLNTEYQRNITIPIKNTNQNQFNEILCPLCNRYYIGISCPYADCIKIYELYTLTENMYYERIANIGQLNENQSNRIWRQCEIDAERQINFTNRLVPRH